MSVGLLIKEGQVGRKILPVEKLKINNIGGGESYWIPEETTEVDSLDVSENGLYFAINDDLDGYDQVNVNVPPDMDDDDIAKGRKITGTGDDGNDYAYGLDEDGNLTVEQIPAAIHIVVPPRKLKYMDGETLDFTGIHVYLMDGNNKRYTDDDYPTGEIPFSELNFPVTVAEGGENGTATLDGNTVEYSNHVTWHYKYLDRDYIDYGEARSSDYLVANDVLYAISDVPGVSNRAEHIWTTSESSEGQWSKFTNEESVNIGGKTYHYAYCGHTYYSENMSEWIGSLPVSSLSISGMIDIVFNGTRSGGQEIPVQWIRSDGETLEDTFKIEIVSEPTPVPEPQPDPWGGYADVSWGGHHYNLNRRIVPEIHYANGYLWQEGTSEYTTDQAIDMGWLILIR